MKGMVLQQRRLRHIEGGFTRGEPGKRGARFRLEVLEGRSVRYEVGMGALILFGRMKRLARLQLPRTQPRTAECGRAPIIKLPNELYVGAGQLVVLSLGLPGALLVSEGFGSGSRCSLLLAR